LPIRKRAHRHMCERSRIAVANRVGAAAAALFLLTVLSASPGFAQISEDAVRQCAALTNTVRRVTCYDLLTQLRVTEPGGTTGQGDGVTTRLEPEQVSRLDAWIPTLKEGALQGSVIHRPKYWSERAEEMRRLAEVMDDKESKEMLRRIAIDYERLALRAKQRETGTAH